MNTRTEIRTLELVKGEHRFIIRYEPGCEAQVREELMEMAKRKSDDYPVDHFDAAKMSLQMGRP